MTTKTRLIRQMMTFICGVTLVACGQAPTVQTSSEYEVMINAGNAGTSGGK